MQGEAKTCKVNSKTCKQGQFEVYALKRKNYVR